MQNEFTPLAARLQNAKARLINHIAERGALPEAAAAKVADLYLFNLRIVKISGNDGQFRILPGGVPFFEKEVIARALRMANGEEI